MKRSFLLGKYLAVIIVAVLILQTGCKRENPYYNAKPINNVTNLTTYDYLKSKPGVYDSLLLLVDELGIKDALMKDTVTLFAVSNSSFQIAIQGLNTLRVNQGLLPVYLKQIAAGIKSVPSKLQDKALRDSSQIDTMVSRYIIVGKYLVNDFAVGDGQMIYSIRGAYPMHGQRLFADAEGLQGGGSEVIEFANTKRNQFVYTWSTATTSSVNIQTKNGIVHILSDDHVFGFDEFISRLTLVPPPPNIINVKTDSLYITWPPGSTNFDGQKFVGEKFVNLFDNSVLTKMYNNWTPSNPITFHWIPRPSILPCNSYSMTTANDSKQYPDRNPQAWIVQGTLDPDPVNATDDKWVTIDTRRDQVWTTNYQQKIFDFNNAVLYTGYRIKFTELEGGGTASTMQLSEWTMNYRKPVL